MSMTINGVRVADLPDLGAVTDDSSFIAEHAGSGRMRATALRDYLGGNLPYTAPYTGGVSRTYRAKAADIVSVKDFGAAGDGIADDTAEINAALATGLPVFFPPGTYNTLGGHLLAARGQAVFGASAESSVIRCTSATGAIFSTVGSTTGVTYRDLGLTRSVTAVAGAYGIDASATHSRGLIENCYVEKQWVGVRLGSTDLSVMRRCTIAQNLSHGVFITNIGADTAFQWTIDTVISQLNAGDGFIVASAALPGAGACALGEMRNLSTFANTGCGIEFLGTVATPIMGIRINGGFFGTDNGVAEIYLNTFGGLHGITNAYVELAGQGVSGPAYTTPASHTSDGVLITANNQDIRLLGLMCSGNAVQGIDTSAGSTLINGCTVVGNGVAGTVPGIKLSAGTAMVTGCRVGNYAGGLYQNYGISIADGSKAAIVGNDLSGNTVGPVLVIANATQMLMVGNLPGGINTIIPFGAVQVGVPTGGPSIIGGLNVAGDIAKNNVPYTSP